MSDLAKTGRLAIAARTEALGKGLTVPQAMEALRNPPPALERARLWALLMAIKGIGPSSGRRVCIEASAFPLDRLADIAPDTREAVAQFLELEPH